MDGAELARVLVGGLEPRVIEIVDHDPAWAARFQRERARIAGALGPAALAIEHIGSTAVAGLAAKPIVDVLVVVADAGDEAALCAQLQRAGLKLRVREAGHLMFRTPERDVHVHVRSHGDPEVDRHLRFRDRLRASAAHRAAYEALKRELAARDWDDMNFYAQAKGPLIEAILSDSRR